MFKTFFSVLAILICLQSFSQKKAFVSAYVGYGTGAQKQFYVVSNTKYFESADTSYNHYDRKIQKAAFSPGMRYGGSVGYKMSDNISFEVGLEYCKSKPQEFNELTKLEFDYGTKYFVNITDKYEVTGRMLSFSSSIILVKKLNKFEPYLKLGVVIGTSYLEEVYTGSLSNTIPGYLKMEHWSSTLKYDKKTSFGYKIAVGCNYEITKDLYIFVEALFNSISYVPERSKYIEYSENDDNVLPQMYKNEKYFEYVDEIQENGEVDHDIPTKVLKSSYSFSSLSVLVGIKADLKLK